jgi:hypothetical protein
MNKLKAFVRLDFMTVKPYFTARNLLILGAVAVFLSAVNGMVQMSVGIGFMLGTLFISYPFAVGEKNNMDALYVTISVNRKTVVLGRYLFTFLLNICAIVFSLVFAAFGVVGAQFANVFQDSDGGDSLALILALSGLLILTQTVQLPIFFKLGYTKAKFVSIVPFALFMGCYAYAASVNLTKESGSLAGLSAALAGILSNGALTAMLAALLLATAVYVSYSLSVAFYSKREF